MRPIASYESGSRGIAIPKKSSQKSESRLPVAGEENRLLRRICGLLTAGSNVSCEMSGGSGSPGTAAFQGPQIQVRVPLLCSGVSDTLERCWAEYYGRFQRRRPLPGIDFQTVRFMVPMARVLELIGFVPHESSGDQLRGPCPIHVRKLRLTSPGSANGKDSYYLAGQSEVEQRRGTRIANGSTRLHFTHEFC